MVTDLDCLLDNYCKRQRVVPKVGKCLGTAFGTGRGVTQGDPASPIILKNVVDVVVRAVLEEVCRLQEAHHVMVWATGDIKIVFYADYRRILGWDH